MMVLSPAASMHHHMLVLLVQREAHPIVAPACRTAAFHPKPSVSFKSERFIQNVLYVCVCAGGCCLLLSVSARAALPPVCPRCCPAVRAAVHLPCCAPMLPDVLLPPCSLSVCLTPVQKSVKDAAQRTPHTQAAHHTPPNHNTTHPPTQKNVKDAGMEVSAERLGTASIGTAGVSAQALRERGWSPLVDGSATSLER